MNIKQDLFDYIELSRISGVPLLLVSNPGMGKTTAINEYAREHNMHVETLIGSRFSPEDILGFQVNEPGKATLIQKDPVWYQRLTQYQDRPSILFIDEISTCSDAVQGSLLSLIFDRKIGNGKPLPENCLVISAANYSGNLPGFMNIMTPTINRFCVVNLTSGYSNIDIVENFLVPQSAKTRESIQIDKKKIGEKFFSTMKSVMMKYSQVDSTLGYIDMANTDIGEIYRRSGNIYNILSGRSMCYLRSMCEALAQLQISDKRIVGNIAGGLAGLGSGSFKSDKQSEAFVGYLTGQLLGVIANTNTEKIEVSGTVTEAVRRYLNKFSEKDSTVNIEHETALTDYIVSRYRDFEKALSDIKDNRLGFVSDMDSIYLLSQKVMDDQNLERLADIHQSYTALYSDAIGSETLPEMKSFGRFDSNFISYVMLAKKKKSGEIVRIGAFGSEANPSYVIITDTVKKATLNRLITGDEFEQIHLWK